MLRSTKIKLLVVLIIVAAGAGGAWYWFNMKQKKTTYSSVFSVYGTSITLDGKKLPSPKAFTYKNTEYLPVYYVHNIFLALGIKDIWIGKGNRQKWMITSNRFVQPDWFEDGKDGTVDVYVNGQLVEQNVEKAIERDPYSGVVTTYVPSWYIEQLLNNCGIRLQTSG